MGSGVKTAFALAGGGAKGAFEAGAVTYLVEECGIVPDVLTGTSAGAICASVLAQARSLEELRVRVAELHSDLLAMSRQELLFGKQAWVAALDGTVLGRTIDRFVVERTRPPVPGAPVAADPSPRRAKWRTAMGLARALPSLRRAKKQLRGGSGSIFTLDPLGHGLRVGGNGISPIDPRLVARPGLELRLAVVAMSAGALRYVTETGALVASDAVTPVPGPAGGPVDLVEGVLASASVPMIFPPRVMAGDAYVDGGVVENIPVGAAARLGARRIYAVLAVPLDPPPDPQDYSKASAPAVFLRSVGAVAFIERQRADLAPVLPEGTEVIVIDPVVDVVGPFEVAQGLMLLDMDYGWLRAADVVAEVAPSGRKLAAGTSDAIASARTQAWHREEAMWRGAGGTPSDLAALVRLKRAVRQAVEERKALGLPVPAGAEGWWAGYEVHAGERPVVLPPDLRTLLG